jgi:hypothetical protein
MVKETVASLKRSLQEAADSIATMKAIVEERDSSIIALQIELEQKVKEVNELTTAAANVVNSPEGHEDAADEESNSTDVPNPHILLTKLKVAHLVVKVKGVKSAKKLKLVDNDGSYRS